MNFEELRELDKEIGSIADGAENVIPSMVRGYPAATAATVLSHLVGSMASLKDGYLDLVDAGNTYASCAVLRIFLEHSLRAMAIFLQSTKQKFTLADGYMRLQETEAKDYLDALERAGIGESELAGSPLEPWFAMGRPLSSNQKKQLQEPFTYKKLIESIRAELGDTGAKSFLLNIIPNYSELSGFVHGGPTTNLMVEIRAETFLEDATLVVSMFYRIKRYLLELVAAMRPEFLPDRDRLDKALDGRI